MLALNKCSKKHSRTIDSTLYERPLNLGRIKLFKICLEGAWEVIIKTTQIVKIYTVGDFFLNYLLIFIWKSELQRKGKTCTCSLPRKLECNGRKPEAQNFSKMDGRQLSNWMEGSWMGEEQQGLNLEGICGSGITQ